MLDLKISLVPSLYDDEERLDEKELVEAINDGEYHDVKISTNKLNIVSERRQAASKTGVWMAVLCM